MELREYLKFELKNLYKVIEATNGKNGLEIARKNKPDVIVADVMMPEMDGFQMTRLLKSEKSTMNIPIVMLTAKLERVIEYMESIQGLIFILKNHLVLIF